MEEPDRKYIDEEIDPILEPMVTSIIMQRPSNIPLFIANWITQHHLKGKGPMNLNDAYELRTLRNEAKRLRLLVPHKPKRTTVQSESESSDDEVEELPRLRFVRRGPRNSISAEAHGIFNKQEEYKPKIIKKSQFQKAIIRKILTNNILFNHLEPKAINIVIDAMAEKSFEEGENVITQGAKGDCLYVVETGRLICNKTFEHSTELQFLREYGPGEAFGELALLYNAPRAANIIAKINSKLWALDRETFTAIIKEGAMKKHERYDKFLRGVKLLSTMNDYERNKVADALRPQTVHTGEYIIKQGEQGHCFYILEKGTAYATKITPEGGSPGKNFDYKKGDYFGELALISGQVRAAHVIAKSECHLLTLSHDSFKMLLGPIEDILKRNMAIYEQYC